MRENRERPVIGHLYRYLKIREKKRQLRLGLTQAVVNVEGTKELYQRDAKWLKLINDYTAGKTLDVGSKYGLVVNSPDVVALDIVKDHLKANVLNDKVLSDACKLPFKNESFETVVATEMLEHLENPRMAIEEFWRVLKSRGRVVMSVPDRYNSFSQPSHIQYFTERKVCQLFSGFEIIVCKVISNGHIFGVFRVIW
jgi:2-polyprenyl-3-methyl-5-hydroxy-6-metoxy-1,4-benzoquinol methylase